MPGVSVSAKTDAECHLAPLTRSQTSSPNHLRRHGHSLQTMHPSHPLPICSRAQLFSWSHWSIRRPQALLIEPKLERSQSPWQSNHPLSLQKQTEGLSEREREREGERESERELNQAVSESIVNAQACEKHCRASGYQPRADNVLSGRLLLAFCQHCAGCCRHFPPSRFDQYHTAEAAQGTRQHSAWDGTEGRV